MRAAVFHGQEDLRIEEVPEPEPAAGQVKLRVAYSGICGSDLHIYFDPDNPGVEIYTADVIGTLPRFRPLFEQPTRNPNRG